ncbi:MAG: heavy-metal-associated domain-containing protein [Taibaiella sp.]|nr:heavy-metal-associated domain-containing protein [Taibaiella sp.]
MKKLLVIATLLLSVPAMAQIKSASLTASGLTCSMCSKAIYKALLKVPSIRNVDVDIEKSTYGIHFKENASVDIDAVKKAVLDAGFSVASMKVTANFNNVAVANDAPITFAGSNFYFLGISKQTLNGDRTLTVLDKDYLSARDYKKYSNNPEMKKVATASGSKTYHVTF